MPYTPFYFVNGFEWKLKRLITETKIVRTPTTTIIEPIEELEQPIFQTIAENQYILRQKSDNNRTLKTGIKKGLEPNSTPKYRKNSR